MRFTIPLDAVARYRSWRTQADLDYLRVQLERRGWASVVCLGDERGLDKITELPAPGFAEPYYGTFGGGFPFTFHPERQACRLIVAAPPLIMLGMPRDQRELPPVAASLELLLPPLEVLAERVVTPGDYGILEDCPDKPGLPWVFGVSGPKVAWLIERGWDSAVVSAYSYTFVPTNVGCFAYVTDAKTGTVINLTEDFEP